MKKKIAIVVQRYGLEVNGGAELHARLLAEKLAEHYQIEVLTTTALNYYGWKNHYAPGADNINGIDIKRFSTNVSSKRSIRRARRSIFGHKKYFNFLKRLRLLDVLDRKFGIKTPTKKEIDNWFVRQGPYCPEMIDYIKLNSNEYDAFIFFTYLYYPTAVGMKFVPEKSIFIPTAHDELIMFTKAYEDIFSVPAFIMYNTLAEKELVESNFKNAVGNNDVAGLGFSLTSKTSDNPRLLNEMGLSVPFFVYIGRIDPSKGCEDLILFFEKYALKRQGVKLVMIGINYLEAKESDNLIFTGFVDDDVKNTLLKNSCGLIIPSKHESLSMVTLEAMAEGKTVVVNAESDVLKSHVLNSGTGFSYKSYEQFEDALDRTLALTDSEKLDISERAKAYVSCNYSWDSIIKKFQVAIQNIVDGKYRTN